MIAAAALVGFAGGGFGGGTHPSAQPAASGPNAASAHANANPGFAGAPTTQRNGYGVLSNTCPLAALNRYLPARAGCVFVRRVDMTGDGRRDLVIVYSLLSRQHPVYAGPVPAVIAHNFIPIHTYVKVVFPDRASTTTSVHGDRSDTAAIDFVTHVSGARGDELFLTINEGSSGGTYAAYGLSAGRLVPAGPLLSIGGDSASQARFNCGAGAQPRLITRSLTLIGPTIYGWWRETRVVYRWRDARLLRLSSRTFRRRGRLAGGRAAFATGCGSIRG